MGDYGWESFGKVNQTYNMKWIGLSVVFISKLKIPGNFIHLAGNDPFKIEPVGVIIQKSSGKFWFIWKLSLKMYSWKHTMNQRAAMAGIPLKGQQVQNRHQCLDQMDEYMKGLTVRDAKSLFTSIPIM